MKSAGYKVLLYGVATILLLILVAFTAVSIDSEGYQTYHGILFGTIGCQIAIHIAFMVWCSLKDSLKDCIKGHLIFTTAELAFATTTTVCSLTLLLWSTKVYDGGFGIFPLIIFVAGLLLISCNIVLAIAGTLNLRNAKTNDIETKLDEIQSLLNSKKITQEEYDRLRAKTIDSF